MKKYLVDIYLANNLGDDMFLDHLANSFPNIQFIPFYPGKKYDAFFCNYFNVKKFPYTFSDKILAKLGVKNKLTDYDLIANEYDGLLFLGGGIFREENYWKTVFKYRNEISDAFLNKSKQVSFIGCNFGPYRTKEFEKTYKELFVKCKSVFFRDQKSYTLFKGIPSVNFAPDILWNYKLPLVTKETKTLGISIVNPKHKFGLEEFYDEYIATHQSLIQEYLDNDYKIKLFSFCEIEGDLLVCKEISSVFKQKIEIFNYSSNIQEFLQEIGSCTEIIAARFHAVIIAMKFKMPILPIIYGDKTRNLLEDLKFENLSIEFEDLKDLKKIDVGGYVYPNIDDFVIHSKKHFDSL